MDATRMVIALVIGLTLLIYLIVKTKVHAFLALIVISAFIGLAGGVPVENIVGIITKGFGNTLGSIGIIIGLGVMMGQIMEESGAAKVMARVFIRVLGKKNEEYALALTGFVVSIPIFADSGFVILAPLAKAISKATKKSIVILGTSLGIGLAITHATVPPTPGPLGVAGIFGINVGQLILFGLAMGVPIIIASIIYAKWIGKKYYWIPGEEEGEWISTPPSGTAVDEIASSKDENLPGEFMSFAPIVVPVILILLNTVLGAIFPDLKALPDSQAYIIKILQFLGSPVIAVSIGLLITIYGFTSTQDRDTVISVMEKGIRSAGIIILITGAGGALGQILRDSGAGDAIAKGIAATSFPAILLPFIISAALKVIQGSGTVAMITASSLTAPIMGQLGVNPLFAAYGACIGSQFVSLFNDSFFWVVCRTIGLTKAKDQILAWCSVETVATLVGMVELLIVNAVYNAFI